MRSHYIVYSERREECLFLTARTTMGEVLAYGVGTTKAEAENDLRALVHDALAERVNEGCDFMPLLDYGIPPDASIAMGVADLFPVLLRRARVRVGLSPLDVAARAGLSPAVYRQLEDVGSNPPLDVIGRIEQVLGVRVIDVKTAAA